MASARSLILASGSLRSLVCTAAAVTATEPGRLVLFHIRDGRPNAGVRREYARKQADYYKITKLIEVELPHIVSAQNTQPQPEHDHVLTRPQILMSAVAYAVDAQIEKVIWPVQYNGDHKLIARTTEQTVLIEHLAQLERPTTPLIELPVLDLTDGQLIELGSQLDVPWHLAWVCNNHGSAPCLCCESCLRRRQAFHVAGVVDPVDKATAPKTP